jgi:hypothetical protein
MTAGRMDRPKHMINGEKLSSEPMIENHRAEGARAPMRAKARARSGPLDAAVAAGRPPTSSRPAPAGQPALKTPPRLPTRGLAPHTRSPLALARKKRNKNRVRKGFAGRAAVADRVGSPGRAA